MLLPVIIQLLLLGHIATGGVNEPEFTSKHFKLVTVDEASWNANKFQTASTKT